MEEILSDYPNPIQAKITLAWMVNAETDENGEIISGHALQISTRILIEGTGAITIPSL
jgi:hypothetical protein